MAINAQAKAEFGRCCELSSIRSTRWLGLLLGWVAPAYGCMHVCLFFVCLSACLLACLLAGLFACLSCVVLFCLLVGLFVVCVCCFFPFFVRACLCLCALVSGSCRFKLDLRHLGNCLSQRSSNPEANPEARVVMKSAVSSSSCGLQQYETFRKRRWPW